MNRNNSIQELQKILTSSDTEIIRYYEEAQLITNRIFGKKRSLINPLYFSNSCINNCPYCNFRLSNPIQRNKMSVNEAIIELEYLLKRGTNKILFLSGDIPLNVYKNEIIKYLKPFYSKINPSWIGVEAVLDENDYFELKEVGVNCVSIFQETYIRKRYEELHKVVFKSNFVFILNTQLRAAKSGIKEVGFGILMGISNWIEDSISMAEHALELKTQFPQLKLLFSFPRIIAFDNIQNGIIVENITEEQITRVITAFRIIFPYESLILTGRESSDFLINSTSIVNIIGKGGSTKVGGYVKMNDNLQSGQFSLNTDLDFQDFKNKFTKSYNL